VKDDDTEHLGLIPTWTGDMMDHEPQVDRGDGMEVVEKGVEKVHTMTSRSVPKTLLHFKTMVYNFVESELMANPSEWNWSLVPLGSGLPEAKTALEASGKRVHVGLENRSEYANHMTPHPVSNRELIPMVGSVTDHELDHDGSVAVNPRDHPLAEALE